MTDDTQPQQWSVEQPYFSCPLSRYGQIDNILLLPLVWALEQWNRLKYLISLMGCGPAPKSAPLQYTDSLIGILKVTILDALFPPEPALQSPTIKIRISNQQFATSPLPPQTLDHRVNQNYNFAINSFYKSMGRTIELAVFEGEKVVAYGAVDANPMISRKADTYEFRCILHADKQKQFGFVTLRAHFEELPATSLTFRFEAATVRRKLGGSSLAVKVTIGEESLETAYQEDKPESPPTWKDQMINFKVPQGVKRGLVELVEEGGRVMGSSQLDLDHILAAKEGDEIYAAEELFYTDDGKEVDAASLRYSYILGKDAAFTEVKDFLRSSVRGIRSKTELDTVLTRPK